MGVLAPGSVSCFQVPNEEGEHEYFGIMYEIASTIATSLNASLSLQIPPDETWGAIDVVGKL